MLEFNNWVMAPYGAAPGVCIEMGEGGCRGGPSAAGDMATDCGSGKGAGYGRRRPGVSTSESSSMSACASYSSSVGVLKVKTKGQE
jgi:hypothetical protein